MSAKTCRDCGNVLAHDARGCPRCAMNFAAESTIDRFLARFLAGLIIVILIVIAFVIYVKST